METVPETVPETAPLSSPPGLAESALVQHAVAGVMEHEDQLFMRSVSETPQYRKTVRALERLLARLEVRDAQFQARLLRMGRS